MIGDSSGCGGVRVAENLNNEMSVAISVERQLASHNATFLSLTYQRHLLIRHKHSLCKTMFLLFCYPMLGYSFVICYYFFDSEAGETIFLNVVCTEIYGKKIGRIEKIPIWAND